MWSVSNKSLQWAMAIAESLITVVRNADIDNTGHRCRFIYLYDVNVCFSLQTLKQDVFQAHKENSKLKLQKQKVEAELQTASKAVHKYIN